MAGPALDYRYVYPFASEIGLAGRAGATQPALRLATFTEEDVHPYFFQGQLRQPYLMARLLLGLSQLVRNRFFVHPMGLPAGFADPIITAHEDFLRWEAFSGCCSAYARVDLPPAGIDGTTLGRGTTNVDFNPALLAALGKIGRTDTLEISVGSAEFVVTSQHGTVQEKRVQLPLRWVKGLVAVTAYGRRLELRHEISAAQATRFLRALPRGQDNRSKWWIERTGTALRASHRSSPGAVQVGGLHRLRILEDLIHFAQRLRVYGHDDVEASCWVLDCGAARFSLLLTHDAWRGFSGEGQGLETLAADVPAAVVRKTKAALHWQPVLDPAELAQRTGSPAEADRGLALLATQGQVGFDSFAGHYYHRVLPFDVAWIRKLQPRLRNARKLVDSQRVAPLAGTPGSFQVTSTDTVHVVRLAAEGNKCTCPWYAKHQHRRGPCKHQLAAQIFAGQLTED